MRRLALVTLALLWPLAAAAGEFRTAEVESLRITIDSDWAPHTTPGYLPVRFDITNLGDARVIEIVGDGTKFSRTMGPTGFGAFQIRQALRMARGDRIRLTVPVPIFAEGENIRFEIQEDGRSLERFNYMGFQSATPAATASAIIVADPSTPFRPTAAAWPRPMKGPPIMLTRSVVVGPAAAPVPAGATPTLDVLLEPSRLPSNWLGYTSVRAVLVGPVEWTMLDAAQRDALLTWAAGGGDLLFPDADASAPEAGVYFFGRIHHPTSESITADGLGAILTAAASRPDADWALPANRMVAWSQIAESGFRVPIPGVGTVPARAYLAILVVFSLLIGPANTWLLWRKRRQALVVLTAPLISAIFILLLAAYVVAGEGLHVSGRAVTVTLLDQARKQAATRASVSLYAAGMTPGGGLLFPRDVAVYPLGADGNGTRDALSLDLTDGQRFSTGAVRARTPGNIEEIAVRTARERLSIGGDPRGPTVVNGLGATVERLVVNIGSVLMSLNAPLPAGGSAVLKAATLDPQRLIPLDLPMSARVVEIAKAPPPGSYLAVLDRSPFWDPGVRGVVERGSLHLVLGRFEGPR